MDRPIILFGATAVGKTAAVSELVRRFGQLRFELISADSRQVYRRFDIGTAKPDARERALLPHHLIDILDGDQPFDAGQFVQACDVLVPEIRTRGAVPVIAGGTAFYLQRYLFGLPQTPPASQEVRRSLLDRLESDGLEVLRRELAAVDPQAESGIGRNDAYRVVRALEVFSLTGRPLSDYHVPQEIREGIQPLVIGLFRPRDELYRRINERVRKMMTEGLATEVTERLADGVSRESPAFRSIGYREFLEVGEGPPWTDTELQEIEICIARNTRRYAKRQELFFRRMPRVRWIHADDLSGLVTTVSERVESENRS